METTIMVLIYVMIIGMFGFNTWLRYLNYSNRNAEIPQAVNDVYDEEKYKKWQEYSMANFKFNMITSTISTVVFVLMLAFGVFNWFSSVSESVFVDLRMQILVFFGLYYVVTFLIGLYPSYYRTFTIEEKYGFNKTTKKTFVTDKIKAFLLTTVIGGSILFGILNAYEYAGDNFFIYVWLGSVVFILIINLIYTSVIVPIFNKLTPLDDGELKDAIFAFAQKVGFEVSQISVMDASKRSSKLNAFFSGFGKVKKIVLYDTLIKKMSTDEIVAVLAHEIGHNKHKHIWFNLAQTVVSFFIYIGMLALMLRYDVFSTAFGFDGVHFGFTVILFLVILEPVGVILGLFSSQFSQRHEYQADAYSAKHYDKLHIETALKVLARENFSNLTPHPLFVKLTYSHPPVVNRIQAIRKVD